LDILVEFERPFGYFTLVRLGTYLEQTSVVESISSLEEPWPNASGNATVRRPCVPHEYGRDRVYDILTAIAKIQRYTAGSSFEAFANDEKTVDVTEETRWASEP
jgi:hypothetical protein